MTYLLDYENAEKNFKLVKTTVTAYDTVGTSWANVSGSQIAYTPANGASKVIYEFNSAYGYLDNDNSLEIKLQIGNDLNSIGDVVTNNVNYYSSFGGTNSTNVRSSDIIAIRYILDISSLSWTGEKTLILQCKTYNSSSTKQSLVNCTTSSDNESNAFLFNPTVICYTI
tara:strand:- start:576 stop:1082 length:507 start_codon:yes stop_codon:yes gene_type:complete